MIKKFVLLFITIIFIIIFSFIIIKFITLKFSPILMEYSKSEIKKVASTIINRSITNDILEEVSLNELFIIDKSNQEEIITVTLDPAIVNRIVSVATNAVENSLKKIEMRNKNILNDYGLTEEYFYVPSGLIFNNTLLNNIGPKIPIKIKLVGNVTSGIDTKIKEYGINNSVIDISLRITVEIKVILPLTSENISITNYIPIALKLVQGKVPIYYGNGFVLDNKKGSTIN